VLRFEKTGIPGECLCEMQNRVNAKPWRRHKPGTVQLLGMKRERLNVATNDFRMEFEFVRPKPMFFMSATGSVKIEVSTSELYGAADFNEFDFGEVVTPKKSADPEWPRLEPIDSLAGCYLTGNSEAVLRKLVDR